MRQIVQRAAEVDEILVGETLVLGAAILVRLAGQQHGALGVQNEVALILIPVAPQIAAAQVEAGVICPLVGAEDHAVARVDVAGELRFPGGNLRPNHRRHCNCIAASADHPAAGVPGPAQIGGKGGIAVGHGAHCLNVMRRIAHGRVGRARNGARAVP